MSDVVRIGKVAWDSTSRVVRCDPCGRKLCAFDENWKDHVPACRGLAAERLNGGEFGSTFALRKHPDVELAEFFCPGCERLLSVEMYLRDEPYRSTYQPLEAAVAAGYDPVSDYEDNPPAWMSFPRPTERAETDGQPVTGTRLEILHNRLVTLMKLMTQTLELLAGNEVGREAGDYSTALMDADGRVVAFGAAVVTHLGHEVKVVPWIYANFGRDRIFEGDIFLSNDPFTGGTVHANDVGLLAPVFADGELIGWVFCDMHCADVGGMIPGSMAPGALDAVAEAIRFPPTKICDAGTYRDDVVRAFVNNSRIPTQLYRDIGAKAGALNVGIRALKDLARQHGVEALKVQMMALQDFSEMSFRARIRSLADGVYEAADYQEDGYWDDTIYRVFVRMTVAGDELYLDFRGTSGAAPSLMNCTDAGLIGGIMGPLIQQLASGIPFNAGVMRPVHIRAEPGSFVNAQFPTPVGLATSYAAWAAQNVVFAAASAALQSSSDDALRHLATAEWGAVFGAVIFSGRNQFGEYSVFVNMDILGEGQGALEGLDGGRGNFTCIAGSIPSVEAHEASEPFLYLAREIRPDSGGAGQWRGGWSLRVAIMPWGDETGPQSGTFLSSRNAIPTPGIFGGYPAAGVYYGPVKGTRAWEEVMASRLPTFAELEGNGELERLAPKVVWEGQRWLEKGPEGEVFVMTFAGGGGYGDPLDRDPDSVASDVREAVVTREAAEGAYGVIFSGDLTVDKEATHIARASLRRKRFRRAEGP